MGEFTWQAQDWHRKDPAFPRLTRCYCDPCPRCGAVTEGVTGRILTVRSNPQSVLSIPDPFCPYDENDPDSPDCTCQNFINPFPDPMFDVEVPVGHEIILHPCGHIVRNIRFYEETKPEPGSLGDLYAEWSKNT